jgi:hypothetical protein
MISEREKKRGKEKDKENQKPPLRNHDSTLAFPFPAPPLKPSKKTEKEKRLVKEKRNKK